MNRLWRRWCAMLLGIGASLLLAPLANTEDSHQPRPSDPPVLPDMVGNSLGMLFLLIPAGDFEMGGTVPASLPKEAARHVEPPHRVWVDAFYAGETEVTVDQFVIYYNELWKSHPRQPHLIWGDSPWRPPPFAQVGRDEDTRVVVCPRSHGYPVTNITWEGASAFAEWLTKREGVRYRLPTEAEWEKAAKAGKGYLHAGGGEGDPKRSTEPIERVGCGEVNPNFLFDIPGNAAEWCIDLFDDHYHETKPFRNPPGPSNTKYGWHAVRDCHREEEGPFSAPVCGSTIFRSYCPSASDGIGFRLVREIGAEPARTKNGACQQPGRPRRPDPPFRDRR